MGAHLHDLRRAAETLPRAPGVYLFKGRRGEILYIGKAKDLRARVQTYLNETGDGRALVPYLRRDAREIETVVTPNEFEALLLENSMIKKERPRYNIRLRDDKSYVSLRYDPREDFSRLEVTRKVRRDGARYLGPFLSAASVRDTLRLILPIHPLRLCTDHVFRNRSRPCVYYQIGRCPAPCVGKITPADYRKNLESAVRLLKGKETELLATLERKMWAASEAQNFEVAARVRDQIESVRRTVENARVITTGHLDRDAFAMARRDDRLVIEALTVRDGRLMGARPHLFTSPVGDEEALTSFLVQYYSGQRGVPEQILIERSIEALGHLRAWLRGKRGARVLVKVPTRGEGVKLLRMAARNAALALEKDLGRTAENALLLDNLRALLGLALEPVRMEAYDISHTAGRETVGVAVTFENGAPFKDGYRRFKIGSAVGGDDYAAMEEVLRRRFTRLLAEDGALPDLVVIDGGKGQLNRAAAVLKEVGVDPGDLDLIALAKGRTEDGRRVARKERREKIHVAGKEQPILLAPASRELHLLDRLRDEAHRFAVTYHRKLRSRERVGSALDAIPGVGPKIRARILKAFGSIQGLQGKSAEEIADGAGVPLRVARRVQERLG
jgi:excinuclease ABC subunit C